MQVIVDIAQGLSIASFAWYGMSCFFSKKMVAEFERYLIGRYRELTGVLQVAGALGLAAGYVYRPILLLSSAGLAAMMLLAVITRVRIRDPFYAALPALSLFGLNLFIFVSAVRR